ncbi:hypothetical protein AFK68_08225, partial [Hydrocoleum sp. CS-953]
MDGLTLAEKIQSIPDYQELPLVMLSSVGKLTSEEIAGRASFAAFVSKPIKQSNLYEMLVSVLGKQAISFKPKTSEAKSILDNEAEFRLLPLRILVAEDVVVNQKVALLVLERLGYRADVANNGLEALEALRRQHYDVVFMDVQMPEMDGLQATRRICQIFSEAKRPWIIAMTAHAMRGDSEECLEAGMNDYISKPVQVEALIKALKNYITRNQESGLVGANGRSPVQEVGVAAETEVNLKSNQVNQELIPETSLNLQENENQAKLNITEANNLELEEEEKSENLSLVNSFVKKETEVNLKANQNQEVIAEANLNLQENENQAKSNITQANNLELEEEEKSESLSLVNSFVETETEVNLKSNQVN